jgi:hypothetical protein
MKLSVTPTRIEIGADRTQHLVATVEYHDNNTARVEIHQLSIGWNDWLDLSDAVRRAMHMMGMHEEPPQEGSKPHGY